MLRSLPAVLLITALGVSPLVFSAAPAAQGCAAKRQDLLQKIDAARAQDNRRQLAGLEKALAEVEQHCDDGSLRRDREAKVAEATAEVRQREADLRAAQATGDTRKIGKRQAKLAAARQDLERAKAELGR